jgi:hypothetical protein
MVLLSLLAVVAFGAPPAQADAASPTVTPAIGLPGIGAPSGTTFDLSLVGYQAAEFFLSGDASSYQPVAGSTFAADGQWTTESDALQAPYTTRIQVYRPAPGRPFSGVVYVEWLNVTNQSDSMPDWLYLHNEIVRRGAAYVGVTAQRVGVTAAVAREPDRYGPTGANLVHPGRQLCIRHLLAGRRSGARQSDAPARGREGGAPRDRGRRVPSPLRAW